VRGQLDGVDAGHRRSIAMRSCIGHLLAMPAAAA
jgi:hypothetical protein